MYHIHHLNQSRSQRIVWMLELLAVDYQIHVYKRDQRTNLAPPELTCVHALGRAPVLAHEGRVIAESGAICDYLARMHPEAELLPPENSEAFQEVQFWSHYAEGSFMPSLVTSMVLEKARSKAKPFFVRYIADKIIDGVMNAYFGRNIKQNFDFVETHLADKHWMVGDKVTLADIQMSFGLEAVYDAGKLDSYPNMSAYVNRIRQRADHQTAILKLKQAESEA